MSYVIFARKFRPQNFEEVIGQEAVATTLRNAIKQNRISQSFLFSGPRGVGKTSIARIFAKALNCETGPTEKPCGKCISCEEITKGNSMDVLEIDGASNRGIDEIRNLRETVKFKPANGQFKIYIIDEVHMLTTEAFNALLKTLEEPPMHVKFVFATTEPHKVPLTILSRCQRYNFKRISTPDIILKLQEITKKEKLKFQKNALYLVAKAADGALRDAESLLDQLASFSDQEIKEEDVLFMLGLASEEVYFRILEAVHHKKTKDIFKIIGDLYDGGRDLVLFAKGLLEVFRHLLLIQCTESADEFIEMSDEGIACLKERKDLFTRGELLLALSIIGNLQNQLRRKLAPPRLLVETALLKLIHIDGMIPASEAPSRIPSGGPSALPLSKPSVKPTATDSSKKTKETKKTASTSKAEFPVKEEPEPPQENVQVPVQKDSDSREGSDLSLNAIEKVWPQIIQYVKSKRMSIGIFLSESQPVETRNDTLILGLPSEFQFHKETLDKNDNKKLIQDAFEIVMEKKSGLQFVITKISEDSSLESSGETTTQNTPSDNSALPEIIVEALDIFDGGRVVSTD